MADKIKSSYKFSKSFYDDAITQGKWWSKLYFKLLWGGVDDNEIARRVLAWIPDDFKGKLLDVPVGTAVFTTEKYKRLEPYYDILDFHVEGAMLYFRAKKR